MWYEVENTLCILDDNITCIDGSCNKCDIYLKRKYNNKILKKLDRVQMTIDDILKEVKDEKE